MYSPSFELFHDIFNIINFIVIFWIVVVLVKSNLSTGDYTHTHIRTHMSMKSIESFDECNYCAATFNNQPLRISAAFLYSILYTFIALAFYWMYCFLFIYELNTGLCSTLISAINWVNFNNYVPFADQSFESYLIRISILLWLSNIPRDSLNTLIMSFQFYTIWAFFSHFYRCLRY